MKIITAPEPIEIGVFDRAIFLAGSIENGKAANWQIDAIDQIRQRNDEDLVVLNPRRAVWDPTWDQNGSNSELANQIKWELEGLDDADLVFFYFQGDTLSPISLLELGRVSSLAYTNAIVVCEKNFWRRANVMVTCEVSGIPVFDTLEDGYKALQNFSL